MFNHLPIHKLLLLSVLCWLSICSLRAQSILDIKVTGNYQNTPIPAFFQEIEQQHPVRFFYIPSWIDSLTIHGQFNNEPFTQVLSQVLISTGLTYEMYHNHYVVLLKTGLPDNIEQYDDRGIRERFIVIGDSIGMKTGEDATLTGYVRDAANGEGFVGATVYVEELERGISTNLNGYYSLKIPSGAYHLQINYVGYEGEQRNIRMLSDGSLSVDLFENTARLEEITIFEKEEDFNITGAQMSVTRLDIQKVKKMPAFLGEVDIINSIEMLPGVSVAGEGAAGFNVRGGDVGQNLVLLDGIPVFNPSHLFGFFSAFNSDMLHDATLYKGGIPAQYGGRIASVLDVSMKDGNLRDFSGSGGIGVVASRLNLEIPLVKDKSSLLIGGRASYSDWILNRVRDLTIRNSEASFYDMNAKFGYRFNDKHKITLSSYLSHDHFLFNDEVDYSYGNSGASFAWDFLITQPLVSSFQATYAKYDYEVMSGEDSTKTAHLASGFEIYGGQWNLSFFPGEQHQLNGGVSVNWYAFQPGRQEPSGAYSLLLPKKLEDEQALETAVYLNEEYQISPKITLNLGLRYSWYANMGPGKVPVYEENQPLSPSTLVDSAFYDNGEQIATYQGFEPRVSLKVGLTPSSSIKASYNRLRQYIHLISNTAAVTPTDIWKLSDPYLQPQIGDQWALGYYKNFLINTIETSLEVFYKDIQNLPEYKNGATLLMNEYLETDLVNARGQAYGVEMFVAKNIGRLTGWLAYTYSRSLRKTESAYREERINQGEYFPSNFDKPHDFTLIANYQFTRRVRLGVNFIYSTGRPTSYPAGSYRLGTIDLPHFSERNQFRIPDYHRLDVSFSIDGNLKKNKKWDSSWTFSIYNLYGRKNPYSVYFVNEGRGLQGYKLSVLGRPFPSITYNFKF